MIHVNQNFQNLMEQLKQLKTLRARMPHKFDNNSLRLAVTNLHAAQKQFGPINSWDVSEVTDMSNLFNNAG